jgi:hypothetical protein
VVLHGSVAAYDIELDLEATRRLREELRAARESAP